MEFNNESVPLPRIWHISSQPPPPPPSTHLLPPPPPPPPSLISRANSSAASFYLHSSFIKLIALALILLLLPVSRLSAVDITVSSSCSLPNAVASAAADSATGGCTAGSGDDTIILNADVSLASEIQITAAAGSITINGNGHKIDAGENGRHFRLRTALTLNLNNVEVINGNEHIGSIYMQTSGVTVNIANSRICSNTSPGTTPGGAFWVGTGTTLNIRNSVICDNAARTAGAINARSGSTLTVASSVFYGNTVRTSGAIIVGGGNATITNSVFYNNRTTNNDGQGGAIFMSGGLLKIDHATLTANTANEGPAIFMSGGTLEIRNSIAYDNTGIHDCRRNGGTVAVNTGNLFGSSNCAGATFSTANPLLVDRTSAATPHYALRAGSPAIDVVDCLTGVNTDILGTSRPQGSRCDIGAFEFIPPPPRAASGNGGGGARAGSASVGVSPAETCAALSPGIMVSNRNPGTACSSVSGSGIGHPAVIAARPASVVDVWGRVTPDTKVCFKAASGSIRFIDTTVLPRAVSTLPAFISDGMLCANIDRAGQVALIADGSAPVASAPAAPEAARRLSDCMVRTTRILNFRDGPGGNRITNFADYRGVRHNLLPQNVVLTALERASGWFKVDYHGTQGWISADYVAPMGLCG